MTLRAFFDGHNILLPKELEGHPPCELEITLIPGQSNAPADQPPSSIWDVVAQSTGTRNPVAILDESTADRDHWPL